MACYHPLKGFIIGTTDSGKKKLKIVPYDTECIFHPFGTETYEPHGWLLDLSTFGRRGRIFTEFVPIPCGQCVGCRLEHSRQWAVRCMLESEYHTSNYFITLTYDNDNVPINDYIDLETGEYRQSMSLCKKDLQDFIKRLRSHFDYNDCNGFRYFACGEYGDRTARPHYHMIAFGLELDDLELYQHSEIGDLFNSPLLTEKWGKGHVVIGNVTFDSCAYVSRYIMKKQKGAGASIYDKFQIEPEYIVMSRRPGIAKQYFEDNADKIYKYDKIVLPGGKLSTPPRYFDNLMNEIDEELMEDIKLKRADIANEIQQMKVELSSASYQEQLVHAERNKEAQIKKLVRPLD